MAFGIQNHQFFFPRPLSRTLMGSLQLLCVTWIFESPLSDVVKEKEMKRRRKKKSIIQRTLVLWLEFCSSYICSLVHPGGPSSTASSVLWSPLEKQEAGRKSVVGDGSRPPIMSSRGLVQADDDICLEYFELLFYLLPSSKLKLYNAFCLSKGWAEAFHLSN